MWFQSYCRCRFIMISHQMAVVHQKNVHSPFLVAIFARLWVTFHFTAYVWSNFRSSSCFVVVFSLSAKLLQNCTSWWFETFQKVCMNWNPNGIPYFAWSIRTRFCIEFSELEVAPHKSMTQLTQANLCPVEILTLIRSICSNLLILSLPELPMLCSREECVGLIFLKEGNRNKTRKTLKSCTHQNQMHWYTQQHVAVFASLQFMVSLKTLTWSIYAQYST